MPTGENRSKVSIAVTRRRQFSCPVEQLNGGAALLLSCIRHEKLSTKQAIRTPSRRSVGELSYDGRYDDETKR